MLSLISTIKKEGHTGGTVECTVCGVRWECETVCKCSGCEKTALCDAEGGEDNAYCVACLTYMGDGVNHSRGGCDGPADPVDPFPSIRGIRARTVTETHCDDAAALGDVDGLRGKAERWERRGARWKSRMAELIGAAMQNRSKGIRYRLAGRIEDAAMMERLSERQIQRLTHPDWRK